MKIIDGFIFYNELVLLKYRFAILKDVVDYFIIVESTHTFSGKEKPLFYEINKQLFEDMKDKIIHIVVKDMPYKYPNINYEKNEQWENEYHQRNSIALGLKNLVLNDEDVIIFSDLDEIPDPNTLLKIKNNDIVVKVNSLEMDFYYYNLNNRFIDKMYVSKIIEFNTYLNLSLPIQDIRYLNCEIIQKGGWHLSYFGDAKFIKNKIQNFAHQELNNDNFTDIEKINNKIKNGLDLFDRTYDSSRLKYISLSENDYLPYKYDEYLNNF